MTGCPSENELSAFLSETLPLPERQALELHLDECSGCRIVVGELSGLMVDEPSTDQPLVSTVPARARAGRGPALSQGTQVGRFLVLELAGKGGMGVVYAAYDPLLDRRVALKFLRPEVHAPGDTSSSERLLTEAKAMARLVHPEVMPIFDVGDFEDTIFIAMEWVEGTTLRERLRAGPVKWPQVKNVFLRAGAGLGAAHEAGWVHGDFKPENVLLGNDGRVRVSDFGLARRTDAGGAALKASDVGGTLVYMAPEQLSGQPGSALSDQYSFCAVLYEALVGRRPFSGDSAQALLDAIKESCPVPGAGSPRLPRWLFRVLRRGLCVNPSERFASMEALLTQLRRSTPVARATWALGTALAVALVALGLGSYGSPGERLCGRGPAKTGAVWNQARRAKLEASANASGAPGAAARLLDRIAGFTAHWEQTYRGACEATHVYGEQSPELMDRRIQCLDRKLRELEALLVTLEGGPKFDVTAATDALLEVAPLDRCNDARYLAAASAYSSRLTPAAAVSSAKYREKLVRARHLLYLGSFETGLAQVDEVREGAHGDGDLWLEAEALFLGAQFQRKMRTHQGQELKAPYARLEEASLLGVQTGNQPLVAEVWLETARLHLQEGAFEEAHRDDRHAEAYIKAAGDDPLLRLRQAAIRASLAMREGQLALAGKLLDEATLLRAQVPAADQGRLAVDLDSTRSLVDNLLGQLERSLEGNAAAVREAEALYGPDYDALGTLHHNAACTELTLNRLDAADADLERAGAIWLAHNGPRHGLRGVHLTARAEWHLAKGDPAAAARVIDEALTLYRELGIEKMFIGVRALCTKGSVLRALSRREDAMRAFVQAVGLIPQAKGLYPFDEAECHVGFGELLLDSGLLKQAKEEFERAAALYGPEAPDNWRRARAELWLAATDSAGEGSASAASRLEAASKVLGRFQVHSPERTRAVAAAVYRAGGQPARVLGARLARATSSR